MAAGTTQFLTGGGASGSAGVDVDVFVPEIWSKLTLIVREGKLLFARLGDRRYEEGLTMGDIVHVNSVSDMAARAKSSETALHYENVSETQTDITISQWYYAAIAIESVVKAQVDRDMLEMYSGKLGYALGLNVDDALAGLMDDFSQIVGTLAIGLSDSDYIRAGQYLDDADAPAEERFFVVSNAEQASLLSMDKYIHDDYSQLHGQGPARTGLETGYVKSFLGTPVYKTTRIQGTNAAGHDNGLFQRSAYALVMQIAPTTHSQFDIDYIVDKVVVEQLYGFREMRDDHGVFMRGA